MLRAVVAAGRVSMSSVYEVDQGHVNPFLDPNTMTEEQLMNKMAELDKKIAAANRAGAGFQTMDQLWALREMLGREFTERSIAKFSNKDKGKDNFDDYLSIG